MPPSSPTSRQDAHRLWWLLFGPLCGLLALHAALFFRFKVDDAFILLRYADNLRHGRGMVFNAGERVEGFTSPALVVIQAAFMQLHLEALTATKLLGLASGFVIVAMTLRLAQLADASPWVAAAAGLLVVAQPSVAAACVNGLETAPFAGCITYGVYRALTARTPRDELITGLVLALSIFLRPEGALAFALAALDLAWRERASGRLWPSFAAFLAPAVLLALPLYAWKSLYFQALVPNTFLAKVPLHSNGRLLSGLKYLFEWSPTQWEIVGFAGLCILALQVRGPVRLMALFTAAWLAYVVSAGGDWIPVRRFLIPLVPFFAIGLALWIAVILRWLASKLPARVFLLRVAVVAICLVWLVPGTAKAIADTSGLVEVVTSGTTIGRERMGQWLHEVAPPSSSVALLDVGAVAYYSDLNVIDLGGLTDARIAGIMHRSPGWYIWHLFFPTVDASRTIVRETLRRRPDFVIIQLFGDYPHIPAAAFQAAQPPPLGAHPQDQAFVLDPQFRKAFRYVCMFPERPDLNYNVFVRNDFAGELPTATDAAGHTFCLLKADEALAHAR